MKIIICDDELQYLTDLKKHIEEYMNNRYIKFDIDTYTDPSLVLNTDISYDIAFLDIQMEKFDGISLAKELKQRNNKVIIFFVTSYDEYQDDAMDLHAFRFFEKPFNAERLYLGLDKAMEYINETYIEFYLCDGKRQTKILVDDIIYIEHQNRKVFLNEKNGSHITTENLVEWKAKLPHSFFYQVHKSFIVNLHYVEEYNYTELYLIGGRRIPIASRKQADFHKYWFTYLRRM